MGIGPYKSFLNSVRNFELLQVSREKSRKTEGGFLGRFKEVRREIEIPPGSFSFGKAKENAGPQLQIIKRVLALTSILLIIAHPVPKEQSFS